MRYRQIRIASMTIVVLCAVVAGVNGLILSARGAQDEAARRNFVTAIGVGLLAGTVTMLCTVANHLKQQRPVEDPLPGHRSAASDEV